MGAPSVIYQQKDLSQVVIGLDSSILGIAGNAKWGPSDKLQPVNSLQQYVQLFGKPIDPTATPLFYQLAGWFKLGRSCYIVRPQGTSTYGGVEAEAGALPAGISAGLSALPTSPSGATEVGIYSKYAGVHDAGVINIEVFAADDTNGTFGIRVGFQVSSNHLVTSDPWFEEHLVSVLTTAKDESGRSMFIKDVLDRDSQLITGVVKSGAIVSDVPLDTTSAVALVGNAYVAATESNVLTAYDLFKSLDAVTIDLIVPGMFTADVLNKCTEVAIARGDCFSIVTPDVSETWTLDGISGTTGWVADLTKNWAAAAYAQFYKMKDEYNDRDVFVPAAGFIAGAYAYNDVQAAQWYAPAGPKRGIQLGVELGKNWVKSEIDTLYDKNLNWVSKSPRYGINVEGQKTLDGGTSALNRVNVARLMLKLRRDLTYFLQDFIYEFNNRTNRTLILNGVTNYLQDIKSREGLYDFRVICDENNNPSSIIDTNRLIVDIYVKPIKVAEFLYLRTTITSSGVDLSKIVSQA